ncbi:MAG: hypothetical protein QG608_3642 [Actinomycetota bacterium]|nr:hypothetical protein [Actinomycetota bacterium]
MLFLASRGLPLLLEVGLLVFCLIDCVQTPSQVIRNLPKVGWIVLIIVLPLAGAIAWLTVGRPRPGAAGPRSTGRSAGPAAPLGPDDDPEFLAEINRVDAEHEEMLKLWEENLRRREEGLRGPDDEKGPSNR